MANYSLAISHFERATVTPFATPTTRPTPEDIGATFQVSLSLDLPAYKPKPAIGPLQHGLFVISGQVAAGQWSLIPNTSPTKRPTGTDGRPLNQITAEARECAHTRDQEM
ncbi:hypothetical protein [Polaromonas sp. JS666]|uniref:hypothetical protein n=1 Tax=Polaromonas sp. (strain JS666 / ATCC BAA-500) TaxID=296591 RepID=UPI0012EEA64C|nr:hypothetical protein [Polaromonas sp. JS666]